LHVLIPLRPGPNQEQVRLVAHDFSQEMARRSRTSITVSLEAIDPWAEIWQHRYDLPEKANASVERRP